jgi:hypothetical protein
VASLLENSSLIAKVISNKSFRLSMDGLATVAWDPDDRDDEPRPLGMLEVRWGQFVEHLVCSPKLKGLETPFKQAQPPAKTHKQPTQNQGAQSQSGLVPLIKQKIKKWGVFSEMCFGLVGDKMGNLGFLGGRRWVGTVEKGRRW